MIPNLVAYHSVLVIKNILDVKAAEKKKEEEKAEREGKKVTFAVEEEEKKVPSLEDSIMKKRVEANMNQSNTAMYQSEL